MVPNKGEQNWKWFPHPYLLGGPKEGANATSPLHSGGSPTPRAGYKIRSGPQQTGKNWKWLPHTCLLAGPKRGTYATSPLDSTGSPTKGDKIVSGCLTHAFSGAQKRALMLHHPCILADPQRQARGVKSEVVPNKGEQNWKWFPHPYLLGGPKEGANATSPLHSCGSPTPRAGYKIRSGPQQTGKNWKWLPHTCLLAGPKRGTYATSPLDSTGSPT